MTNTIDISLLRTLCHAERYEITEGYASDLLNIAVCLLGQGRSKIQEYARDTIIEWLQNADVQDELLPIIDGDVSDIEAFIFSVQRIRA